MPLPFIGWFMASKLGRMLAAVGVLLAAAAGLFFMGKSAARKDRKIADMEREKKDREKLDKLKPSSERDAVDRLRNNGF